MFPSEPNPEALRPKIEVEPGYEKYIPEEFKKDPVRYFNSLDTNVKGGEITRHNDPNDPARFGSIKDDPTTVKDFPRWFAKDGTSLDIVARRVNPDKGMVRETGDPFHEYEILRRIEEANKIAEECGKAKLPAAKPVAKVTVGTTYFIIMERIPGIRFVEKDVPKMIGENVENMDEVKYYMDIEDFKRQTEQHIRALQQLFAAAGITRTSPARGPKSDSGWDIEDMVFTFKGNRIETVTPTDWERADADDAKMWEYKRKLRGRGM